MCIFAAKQSYHETKFAEKRKYSSGTWQACCESEKGHKQTKRGSSENIRSGILGATFCLLYHVSFALASDLFICFDQWHRTLSFQCLVYCIKNIIINLTQICLVSFTLLHWSYQFPFYRKKPNRTNWFISKWVVFSSSRYIFAEIW